MLDFTGGQIEGMLKIFGPIVAAHVLPLPDGNAQRLIAHVFDFASAIHAQAAVDAIGDQPGTTFSLHLADASGAVPAPSNVQHMQLQGHASERSDTEPSPLANARDPVVMPRSSPRPLSISMHQSSSEPTSDGSGGRGPNGSASSGSETQRFAPAALSPGVPLAKPLKELDVGRCSEASDGGSGGSKAKRRMEQQTTFDPNEAAAGGPRARTTIMVRNIPCRWTAEDFLSVLKPIIGADWDLLYVPCKTSEVANSGYAFLNFETSAGTLRLYNAMHGRHWPNSRSGKVCEIRYARIQGRQLLSHLGSNEKGGAAAFRGYLAYPSGGQVIVHGPDSLPGPTAKEARLPPTAPLSQGAAAMPAADMAPPQWPHPAAPQYSRELSTPVPYGASHALHAAQHVQHVPRAQQGLMQRPASMGYTAGGMPAPQYAPPVSSLPHSLLYDEQMPATSSSFLTMPHGGHGGHGTHAMLGGHGGHGGLAHPGPPSNPVRTPSERENARVVPLVTCGIVDAMRAVAWVP